MWADRDILMTARNNILLIVVDLQGIFDQQLRHHQIHSLNMFIILIKLIKLLIIKVFRGQIFSCERPIYEWAVSDLDP